MSFEEKIKELENTISLLENGNSTLQDSIEKYTKAMQLSKECDEELSKVEGVIAKILNDNKLEDFNVQEN